MRTVEIAGVAHPFKYGFGAMLYAEEVLEKAWADIDRKTLKAQMALMAGCFFNGDENFPYNWYSLMEECDKDPSLWARMNEELFAQSELFGKSSKDDEDDKKKG